MGGAHADVSKHVRAYMAVFGALAVFTVVTVWASIWHMATPAAVAVALLIASVKASLVAAIFMHLKWERCGAIWWTLLLAAVFFVALLSIPAMTAQDMFSSPQVYHGTWTAELPAPAEPAHHSDHAGGH
jgi:cytochrome c oxidase subunit 4